MRVVSGLGTLFLVLFYENDLYVVICGDGHYNDNHWHGGEVVTLRSAKPPCGGSIPPRASKY
jgi:hypothetical protein